MPGIALVTGANQGIGLEVARKLAATQWRVFLTGRSPDAVDRAASLLSPSVIPVVLDVTDHTSIDRAVKIVSETVDHLDVLVNNAGILDDHDDTIWDLLAERLPLSRSPACSSGIVNRSRGKGTPPADDIRASSSMRLHMARPVPFYDSLEPKQMPLVRHGNKLEEGLSM